MLLYAAVAERSVRVIAVPWRRWGPFIPYDVPTIRLAQWLLVGALALTLVVPAVRRALTQDGAGRWVRLPLLLGLTSSVFLVVAKRPPKGEDYYYLKTHVHAVMMMCAAAVVLAAALASRLVGAIEVRELRLIVPTVVIVALIAGAGVTFHRGFEPWHVAFRQRAFGKPPFHAMWPLEDLDAMARIRKVLAEKHAEYGGYMSSFYPLMTFMNSEFGFPNGGIDFYMGKAPNSSPGHCVFWEWCEDQANCLEIGFRQRGRLQGLMNDEKSCVGYKPHWNPDGMRTLCWKCY
jgi:hypothetical protein